MKKNESAVFEMLLKSSTFPYVSEHRIQGAVVVPGTFFVEMALATAMAEYGSHTPCLENVEFHEALFLSEQGERAVRFFLDHEKNGKAGFRIASAPSGSTADSAAFTVHVTGDICIEPDLSSRRGQDSPKDIQSRCTRLMEGAEHVDSLKRKGFEFGPAFREVVEIWCGDNEALGNICFPEHMLQDMASYYIHPALLDGCLQVCAGALRHELNENAYLPVGIGKFRLFKPATECLSSHALIRTGGSAEPGVLEMDINIFDDAGELVSTLTRLRIQQFERVAPCAVRDGIRDYFYEIEWELSVPEIVEHDKQLNTHEPSAWVLFSDCGSNQRDWSAHLKTNDMHTVLVTPGEMYYHKDTHHFEVKPGDAEHLKYLLNESALAGTDQCNLLYLSNFARVEEGVENPVSVLESCASLLALIQAVIGSARRNTIRLWIATTEAHGITPADRVDAGETALWGLARVFSREYPELWGGIIDVAKHESYGAILHLLAERAGNPHEDQIAYREGKQYVARLVQCEVSQPAQQLFAARPDRTYLITGGFGGLGLEVAHWLVRQGARHLALLGRGAGSQADTSDKLVSLRPGNSGTIETLRQLGACVYDLSADVGDAQEMKSAMAKLQTQAPPVAGVIHAAGISDDATLGNMTPAQLAGVMRAKVAGASILHTLSLSMELDFFVMFSSLSAVVGTPGQGNYAAANAFMDGLAQARVAAGLTGLSVGWGPWDGIGMTKTIASDEFARHGVVPLLPEQGCEALGILLESPDRSAQKVVSHMHWETFARYANEQSTRNLIKNAVTPVFTPDTVKTSDQIIEGPIVLEKLLSAGSASRRVDNIIAYLQEQAAKVLGMAVSQRIDPAEPLLNYGFESLMALRLRSHLENDFQKTFPATLVFDYPTLGELAVFLENELFVGDSAYREKTNDEDDAILALLEEVEQLSEHSIQSQPAPQLKR